MRKHFTLLVALLLVSVAALAEKITQAEALQAAMPYMKSMQSVSSQRQARAGSTDQPVYIFSRGAGEGFVIVSGDNSLPLVLGVADSGDWDEDDMPPLLLMWVKMYEQYVDSVQSHGGAPARAARASVYPKNIPALLTSHWHQSSPYNDLCPQRSDGGGRAVTGCVATAAAQIAYYWRNEGVNAVSQYDTPTYGYGDAPVTSVIVEKGTPFEWDKMTDSRSSSAEGNAAMARLCVLMGTCGYLSYGASTGGYIWDQIPVFRNQIGLNGGTHLWKYNSTQTAFETICANDLAQGRPILYAGYNAKNEGHAVVMDGYSTSNNSFHFNFGWGGQGDGYYLLVDEGVNGFGYNASIVYDIYSPNINRTFSVEPESEDLYQYLPNYLNVTVENGSSMAVKGAYLFVSSSKTLPESYTLDNAIASHPGELVAGDSWEARAVYETPNTYPNGVYFIITDENLSVLYTSSKSYKVSKSSANMTLQQVIVDSDYAEEQEFNYNGETVKRTVYRVESNSYMHMDAVLYNSGTARVSSTKCMPQVTALIYKVESDGSVTKVTEKTVGDSIFLKDETKTLPFDFSGLQKNTLYKASIHPRVGNGSSTTTSKLLYDAEYADTLAFFTLAISDMEIARDGNHVTISGTGYTSRDYTNIMKDETVTSIDMRAYTDVLPDGAPVPSNPNAIVYRNEASGVTGRNIVVNGVCEELELQKGYDYDPVESFKAKTATMHTGTVSTAEDYYWNSIALPFTATTPYGMLARCFTGNTAKTEEHSEVMAAGTPYVYLMTHAMDITAENVDVMCIKDMPASKGSDAFTALFSNMTADGTQSVTTGQQFEKVAAGTQIDALTGYRTDEVSLTNMSTVSRLDAKMHALVASIVAARDSLMKYAGEEEVAVSSQHRSGSRDEAIATFRAAIAEAEQTLTLLPSTYAEVNAAVNVMTTATTTFVSNEDVTAIAVLDEQTGKGAENTDHVVYDINGRRLTSVPEKGIYIIGGKKYVK